MSLVHEYMYTISIRSGSVLIMRSSTAINISSPIALRTNRKAKIIECLRSDYSRRHESKGEWSFDMAVTSEILANILVANVSFDTAVEFLVSSGQTRMLDLLVESSL